MGGLATLKNKAWTSDAMIGMRLDQCLWENVAIIEAVNIGRSAATVRAVGLELSNPRRFTLNLIGRDPVTLAFRLLDLGDTVTEPGLIRIEAGELKTWAFPLSSLHDWMAHQVEHHGKRLYRMRATCEVAGRNRPARSRSLRAWQIGRPPRTEFRYAPVTDLTRLFRQLLQLVPDGRPATAYEWLLKVSNASRDGDSEVLDTLLDLEIPFIEVGTLAMQIRDFDLEF